MANILILGGGFGGVVAAERLARALDPSGHQITPVSRSPRFTFYPALVRLAFGVEAALKFGEAVKDFKEGHAVIGSCPGSRLEVPVYETAFALVHRLREENKRARVTILSPDYPSEHPGGADLARALRPALER